MPFAGMDDTAQQSLIDKLDQRLAKRKEQQAREEEKAKEREKLENARRNKEALHAKLLEVAGSGRRVAALDDLQGACDAALSRRDAPDDLAPAYDTFLAAMTSWLELVGG